MKARHSGGKKGSLSPWKGRSFLTSVWVVLCLGIWGVGFAADSGPNGVLPDTDTQFSLDLSVTANVEHDLVYVVEQRARPFYRIFAFDPANGEIETVYAVPKDAIIRGIALSPDRSTLAVAYTQDLDMEGNGIWTLDIASKHLEEHVPTQRGVYLTDLEWAPDGASLLATKVDRTSFPEKLTAARISIGKREVATLAVNAINPVQLGDDVYYLSVDAEKARRSVGVIQADGVRRSITVGSVDHDLDHLVADHRSGRLWVAVIDSPGDGVTLGASAEAHGNHVVPSVWWTVNPTSEDSAISTSLEPIIVYDAAVTSDAMVYATNEGLSIGFVGRIDVIASRAIRLVAA